MQINMKPNLTKTFIIPMLQFQNRFTIQSYNQQTILSDLQGKLKWEKERKIKTSTRKIS